MDYNPIEDVNSEMYSADRSEECDVLTLKSSQDLSVEGNEEVRSMDVWEKERVTEISDGDMDNTSWSSSPSSVTPLIASSESSESDCDKGEEYEKPLLDHELSVSSTCSDASDTPLLKEVFGTTTDTDREKGKLQLYNIHLY